MFEDNEGIIWLKVDNELTKEAEKLFKEMEGKMEN